jgi:hypothetical protein
MAHADTLASEGKRNEAVPIWQSIVDLYAQDSASAAEVESARRKLATSEKAQPTTGGGTRGDGNGGGGGR